MTERSVFYTSNSHSDIFPNNTRGSFENHIDENEFDYLDSKHLSVAIKSVTFENKFNAVTSRFGYPNMIIIQENWIQARGPLALEVWTLGAQGPWAPHN